MCFDLYMDAAGVVGNFDHLTGVYVTGLKY